MSENTTNVPAEVSEPKLRFTKRQILQASAAALVVAAVAWLVTDTVKTAKALDSEDSDDVDND